MSIRNLAPLMSPSSVFGSALAVEKNTAAQISNVADAFIGMPLIRLGCHQKYNSTGGLIAERAGRQDRAGHWSIARDRRRNGYCVGSRWRFESRNSFWRLSGGCRADAWTG